jgi:hypothetical protein
MNKNRGRKPNCAVLSGIKPDQEPWDEIRARIIYGSAEWPMVAVRHLIKNGPQPKDNPFWKRLGTEFERAVTSDNAEWFRRQAKAIEKGGLPQRAQFNAKVVYLLEHAMCETLGRPENWQPLTQAERKAFPNLRLVPHVITLTPAGKFTYRTARDIYNALEKREVWVRKGKAEVKRLVVEGYQFENKERVMQAIHDLATLLDFALKKQVRKR